MVAGETSYHFLYWYISFGKLNKWIWYINEVCAEKVWLRKLELQCEQVSIDR